MLTIKCAKCKQKLFKYHKIGMGRVLRCWKNKIKNDNTIRKDGAVFCTCGNRIGIEMGNYIKMDQSAFIYSGTKQKG
jgi:hypothetical protein